jgi:hypothetical protein
VRSGGKKIEMGENGKEGKIVVRLKGGSGEAGIAKAHIGRPF